MPVSGKIQPRFSRPHAVCLLLSPMERGPICRESPLDERPFLGKTSLLAGVAGKGDLPSHDTQDRNVSHDQLRRRKSPGVYPVSRCRPKSRRCRSRANWRGFMPTPWRPLGDWRSPARWCPVRIGSSTGSCAKRPLVSSQIEGTQATLEDVVAYEATRQAERPADVQEVCNYIEALSWARAEIGRAGGLPLCTRLLCQAHRRLMQGVRGAEKQPGKVRTSQNWIGGTRPGNARFVPPPPEAVPEALAKLEQWIHGDRSVAAAGASGLGARPIRDDPSVPGRQRPHRPAADRLVGRTLGSASCPAVVYQLGVHAAPAGILSPSDGGSHARRLGGLDGVFPPMRSGGCRRRRASGRPFVRVARQGSPSGPSATRPPRFPPCGCSTFCPNTP